MPVDPQLPRVRSQGCAKADCLAWRLRWSCINLRSDRMVYPQRSEKSRFDIHVLPSDQCKSIPVLSKSTELIGRQIPELLGIEDVRIVLCPRSSQPIREPVLEPQQDGHPDRLKVPSDRDLHR